MRLLDPLFRWADVEACFSDRARLQGMLDFEAGLARAEARVGLIPVQAAPAIVARCRAELFDVTEIANAAAVAGNPAIPLVRQLTALVEKEDEDAARFVHWGATSQDAIDTGLVLQLRGALFSIEAELSRLGDALAKLAQAHRSTPVAARTLLQQALPTTLGLKAASWLDAVDRHGRRLAELQREALVLQFGGAAGTLAALGSKGPDVAAVLADELKLRAPELPWHTQRDRLAEVATSLGLCTGSLGKIARDLSLAMQTEVGELHEPSAPGRGGSSTLPHKRNPVAAPVVLAAATRVPGLVGTMLAAMVQEEQRGVGGWHAEWETLPEIASLLGGALHHLSEAVVGLEVDSARMRANLEITQGLIFAEAVQMALGESLGRAQAHELVEAACRRARAERRHLREVLAADQTAAKLLSPEALQRLFEPQRYLGAADVWIDRALAAHASSTSKAS